MKIYSKKLYIPILLIALSFHLRADNNSPVILSEAVESPISQREVFAIHPQIGYLYNLYSSNFSNFQGAVDCGIFKKGSGSGYSALLEIERKITNSICLGIGCGYFNKSGTLMLNSTLPVRDDINSGNVEYVTTENRLLANLGYLDFQADVHYVLADKFINGPLRFVAGPSLSFPLLKNFSQSEYILSPENATFKANNRKDRAIASGTIQTIRKTNFGISFGFENLLSIGNGNFITQQILFDYNFSNVTESENWKNYAFRFSAGLRFSIRTPEKMPALPPIPLPPQIDTGEHIVNVLKDTSALTSIATIKPSLEIKINGFEGYIETGNALLATLPLVNAIFFPRNSDEIPTKYIINTDKLPSMFTGDAVNIHRYIIPRIASIISKNSGSKLILAGATSGKDNEPDGFELAQKRAEAVYQAFLRSEVDEKIIKKQVSLYPKYESNQDFEKGQDENQRVDIFVEKAPLQEYVSVQKFIRLRGSVNFKLDLKNISDNRTIKITPSFYDTTILCSKPETITIPVTMPLMNTTDKISLNVTAQCDTLDSFDEFEVNPSKLVIKETELNLSGFEAVLRFDYNSPVLSDDNKGLLKQMSEILPEGTTVMIYGSADTLGTEQRNRQLEYERAVNTQNFINSVAPDKFKIITGTTKEKYPQNSEEGRFLNRSIKIRLKR
jgi:outer membrane protein OmpA-like peptidoglycan-associated protein